MQCLRHRSTKRRGVQEGRPRDDKSRRQFSRSMSVEIIVHASAAPAISWQSSTMSHCTPTSFNCFANSRATPCAARCGLLWARRYSRMNSVALPPSDSMPVAMSSAKVTTSRCAGVKVTQITPFSVFAHCRASVVLP
jgi:hypothetical protein